MASLILLLLIGFPYLEMIQPSFCIGDVILGCRDIEREALLEFKKGLTDPSGRLSSWHGEDCCKWAGVGCSNYTGHVIKLDLHNQYDVDSDVYRLSMLRGEVNPSLSQLKQLNFLDLSFNNFSQIPIPKFIGSLSELKYLNLSTAMFQGDVPPHIGNLSSLQYLDLSNWLPGLYNSLKADNLHWLAGLSSLKLLSLTSVNLSMVGADWLQQVNTLPRLLQLSFQNCKLQLLPVSPPFLNFTSLEVLDLSYNEFNSVMPRWLFNCTELKILDLSANDIHGPLHDSFTNMASLESISLQRSKIEGRIPRSLGTLCWLQSLDLSFNFISGEITEFIDSLAQCSKISLKELHLSSNKLTGHLPNSVGNLRNLQSLDLSYNKLTGHLPNSVGNLRNLQTLRLNGNQMNGTVPKSLGKLTQLVEFSVFGNSWDGFLSEVHFSNLQNLKMFQISSSSSSPLILNISSNWNPPFNLTALYMVNCQVGSQVPVWLKSQHSLVAIVLRNAGISGSMPDWLMVWYPLLQTLDLSYNKIRGGIPQKALLNLEYLNLGNNLFTGSIPSNIGEIMPKLVHLDISRNLLTGRIPSSVCKMTDLVDLILSNNYLSGKLPQGCSKNFFSMRKLDVSENNLSGEIPRTIGSQSALTYLDLSNNYFSGELHSSLRNCTLLTILDLGENHLSGNLPTWIGKALISLKVLVLRSNMFVGHIPKQLCFLSSLQLLDVSNNGLQGRIPHCFDNLSSMAIIPKNGEGSDIGGDFRIYVTGLADVINVMVIKGIELKYSKTLGFVRSIDLSSNHLSGGIPNQLTELLALGSLNLSSNHLTGRIPEDVGNLNQLELLDLSRNRLSGPIPQSLSNLTSLNHLNLSSNNFSGKIPTGHQLQTLTDPSIYRGNPELCGSPIETSCPSDEISPIPGSSVEGEENRESSTMLGFYISMVLGFIVGFWGFCGTLFFKKSWRYVYFRFLERNIDKIHVFIAVKIARWKRGTEMDIK